MELAPFRLHREGREQAHLSAAQERATNVDDASSTVQEEAISLRRPRSRFQRMWHVSRKLLPALAAILFLAALAALVRCMRARATSRQSLAILSMVEFL